MFICREFYELIISLILFSGEGFPTPECIRGQFPCHCPEGYFFEFPQNTCEPRGPGEEEVLVDYPQSHGGGLPYPYPGGHLGLGEYPDYFGTVDGKAVINLW